jgi:hypothetical protein
MTDKKELLFQILPPGPEAQRFADLYPDGTWQEGLTYFLEKFPQVVGKNVQWLLDGGAVMHLMYPSRKIPRDLDILTRNDDLPEQFSPSVRNHKNILDVKSLRLWMQLRNLPYDPKQEEFFFNGFQTLDFYGHKVHAVKPVILALGKSQFWNNKQRDIDKSDISLLAVSRGEVNAFLQDISSNT